MEEYGECNRRQVDPFDGLCYLGNKDDMEEDIRHRFKIIKEVLHTLKEDSLEEFPEVDHSPHVLKIFMLPEFYMRGPNGDYSKRQLEHDGLLNEVADDLRALVAENAFEDYLFVFGTVIAAEAHDDPKKTLED